MHAYLPLKFNRHECRVLSLGKSDSSNPTQQYWLGEDVRESSSAEKDLRVLGDNKLTRSLAVCLCGQKGQWCPGCIRKSSARRLRDVILHFT